MREVGADTMSKLQGEVTKVCAGKDATCRGFDEGREIRIVSRGVKNESPERFGRELESRRRRGVDGRWHTDGLGEGVNIANDLCARSAVQPKVYGPFLSHNPCEGEDN